MNLLLPKLALCELLSQLHKHIQGQYVVFRLVALLQEHQHMRIDCCWYRAKDVPDLTVRAQERQGCFVRLCERQDIICNGLRA